ncbi:MAG: hypothetical protein K9G48_10695 [Reyranella sp.]|nr:hypothetical protein [Reyranella sp.]
MNPWLSIVGLFGALIAMPAVAQERFTGDLCGNKADLVLKTPGADANPELKKFFGVWDKGKWDYGMCNALAVTEINGNAATVHYFYGVGVGTSAPGSFVKTDAVMKGKHLFFKSKLGYDVSYELTGGQLMGWFGTTTITDKLQKLK